MIIFKFLIALLFCVNGYLYSNTTDSYQTVFTTIYDKGMWGRNNLGVGHSGGGSTVENTSVYTDFLRNFIDTHEIKSIVDAGCGDWEFSRYIDWGAIKYIGYDVVEHVIKNNSVRYAKPNISFIHANFLKEDLPSADLLICKHVLQHIPNQDIILFLAQLPKFKYCLITNEVNPGTLSSHNDDTSIGGGHKVDLSRPPFNLTGAKVLNYQVGRSAHQVFLIDNTGN
jgi:2-polyprenyl-3-methyl-5-hydroxy-6-metoxy-1,4-benzoquinol methylase